MPITLPAHQRRLAVALPVKPFREAKRRLTPLFEDPERAAFARVMFLDVLTAVCEALPPQDVFVVTADAYRRCHDGKVDPELRDLIVNATATLGEDDQLVRQVDRRADVVGGHPHDVTMTVEAPNYTSR